MVGWGIKKTVQAKRADEAKRQVSPIIDEIEHNLIKNISEKYNDFASSCNESLDNILKSREAELIRLKESLTHITNDDQEDILKADLDYIINKQKEF